MQTIREFKVFFTFLGKKQYKRYMAHNAAEAKQKLLAELTVDKVAIADSQLNKNIETVERALGIKPDL